MEELDYWQVHVVGMLDLEVVVAPELLPEEEVAHSDGMAAAVEMGQGGDTAEAAEEMQYVWEEPVVACIGWVVGDEACRLLLEAEQ